jgi:putative transposase
VTEGVPGTTFRSIEEKGDYDSIKHACLTLQTLKTNIMQWITDEYHQRPHDSLDQSPNQTWKSGISPDEICYPDDSTHLDAVLGSAYWRTLTHDGIEFFGLRYTSPELAALRRSEGQKLRVEIRVNEDDLGSIYVLWPDYPKPIEVPVDEQYARGLSLHAHKVNRARQRENPDLDQGAEGRMQVATDISRRIAEDAARKRGRMSKRAPRYLEGSPHARAQREPLEHAQPNPDWNESTEDSYSEGVQLDGIATSAAHDQDDNLLSFKTTYKGEE